MRRSRTLHPGWGKSDFDERDSEGIPLSDVDELALTICQIVVKSRRVMIVLAH
jgi:hypothetical protein